MNKVIILVIDIIFILLSYVIGYILKFKLGLIYNIVFDTATGLIYSKVQIEPYFDNIGVVLFFWILSLYICNAYKTYSGLMTSVDQFISVVKASSLATLIIYIAGMLQPIIPNSQSVFIYTWIVAIILLHINRMFIVKWLKLIRYQPENTMILGHSMGAQYLLERISFHKNKEFKYLGTIADKTIEDTLFSLKNILKPIGKSTDLETILLENRVKHIFVCVPDYPEKNINKLVAFCEINKIKIYLYHTQSQALSGVSKFLDFSGIPVITYQHINFSWKERFIKRLIDVLVSVILIICLSPLFIIVFCWIKCVSPQGSPIFTQKRVGRFQKEFTLYKFRTMPLNKEDKTGPSWTLKSNSTTFIKGGQWLRRYSIDELPQLVNILKNEMSLIGPRPERKHFVDKISEDSPFFNLRHNIKGGLTGWAQIHGRAYLTNRPVEKFQYDLYYIKNWSLILDLKILLKTISVVFTAEEAY